MKTYFAVSDIHSFIVPLIKALDKVGFDKNNKDHILIVCGDIFDRGFDTLEVYNFLTRLPEDQLILIRGNHELLYQELLDKDFPEKHDFSNGTVRTFCQIAGEPELDLISGTDLDLENFWRRVKEKVRKSIVTDFINSDRWLNYYELNNYIFVHSFIPVRIKNLPETKWYKNYPTYQVNEKYLKPVPWWRTKTLGYEWNEATWGCPYRLFEAGLFDKEVKKGKTLVCGHWHAADFHSFFEGAKNTDHSTYIGEHLIALDACTALSDQINVYTIMEN